MPPSYYFISVAIMKILFSNLGYARGISGSLYHHIAYANRHVYSPRYAQKRMLKQFRDIIDAHQPDLCCMVEVDRGSIHSGYLNQLKTLMCDDYCVSDIANKYGEERLISKMPLHWGKSNAFLSRKPLHFERKYFLHGTKRLIYQIQLSEQCTLFFTHFSLQQKVRRQQFQQIRELMREVQGEVILFGDFNIFAGTSELQPLLDDGTLVLLNDPSLPTFTFHKQHMMLDLCMCTPHLKNAAKLQVIPQSFSDHAALLLDIDIVNTT